MVKCTSNVKLSCNENNSKEKGNMKLIRKQRYRSSKEANKRDEEYKHKEPDRERCNTLDSKSDKLR